MHNFLLAAKTVAENVENTASKDVNDVAVVVLGISIVFIGLISIIILCKILGVCCKLLAKKEEDEISASAPVTTATAPAIAPTPAVIPNRRETVAAIAAAIAEDLGEDISAIRIVSIEKL